MACRSLTHLDAKSGWHMSETPLSLTQHPKTVSGPQGMRLKFSASERTLTFRIDCSRVRRVVAMEFAFICAMVTLSPQ